MNKKVALITGSATGLGRRTAVELAKNGIDVVLNYVHSSETAKETSRFISKTYGVRSIAIQADVGLLNDVQKLVSQTRSVMGGIDILIHNAGPFIKKQKKMSEYTIEEWNFIINGNLNSVFYLSKEVLPLMRSKRWGRMITIGFDRVETAPAWNFRSAYAAAKSGTASLTKTLAIEEAENGITVNMVCPGDIQGKYKEMNIEDVRGKNDLDNPVGRTGTGEDIARVISFLCNEDSDFITGSVISVTGGKDVLNKRVEKHNTEE
ncbi:SDR family oxidoreductase [Terrilactibacillus sp. BCM23-1]|uniref:SDR family oxidoreductase n=1 Tax=Terrilactibacillus tamarindi TaxID=2599694 RepID=A0A6N8CRF0_9BACI|nr:SDR family oxidoreductase [Terrilactibacillus tamarindi]MTT30546.1 SDR family oxidoreductase [Terrilactibacillus tamarindi]